MNEKLPYQMTRKEYLSSYQKVLFDLFKLYPDKEFIIGMEFHKAYFNKSGQHLGTFRVTGQNDLKVGYYTLLLKNGKLNRKEEYVLSEYDARQLFVKKAIDLELDVPQGVLDEYNSIEEQFRL